MAERTKKMVEAVSKGLHEVAVYGNRRPVGKDWQQIASQRQALPIPMPRFVSVEDIRIAFSHFCL